MQEKQLPQQNQGRCFESSSITGCASHIFSYLFFFKFLSLILPYGILVSCFGYIPNSTASLVPNMLPGHSRQRATRPCSCHVERRPLTVSQVASDDEIFSYELINPWNVCRQDWRRAFCTRWGTFWSSMRPKCCATFLGEFEKTQAEICWPTSPRQETPWSHYIQKSKKTAGGKQPASWIMSKLLPVFVHILNSDWRIHLVSLELFEPNQLCSFHLLQLWNILTYQRYLNHLNHPLLNWLNSPLQSTVIK